MRHYATSQLLAEGRLSAESFWERSEQTTRLFYNEFNPYFGAFSFWGGKTRCAIPNVDKANRRQEKGKKLN
jgi:hypothetical protein